MAYGDKRDYPKIHLFRDGIYVATTTWAKSCKEAVKRFWDNPSHGKYAGYKITARYAEPRKRSKAYGSRKRSYSGKSH